LGFEHKNMLVLSADPQAGDYNAARTSAYYAQLAERLAAIPGVKSLGLAAQVPLSGAMTDLVRPDNLGATDSGKGVEAHYNIVSPSYFNAVGIPLLRGRPFTEADGQGRSRSAMISQAMADLFWAGRDPIGRRFFAGGPLPYEVIGVVRDTSSPWPGQTDGPFYYLAAGPGSQTAFALMIRTDADWRSVVKPLRESATALDPNVAVLIRPLDEIIAQVLGPVQLAALLASALGLLAVGLVAVGLYGVVAYTVSQRTREIGVRMALGAGPGLVQRQIVTEGVRVVAAGLVPGFLLAAGGSWVLQRAIFGLSPLDPVTFAGVGGLLLTVTAFACWLPAQRAAKVNPVIALRAD
ncbi:MAG: ABC transporter permease, partial [Lacunisphaera sp.]|nr:ABC transporter permease [Lacunisphaera sp.]